MNTPTDLKARILVAVKGEPSPTRASAARQLAVVVVVAVVMALVLFFWLGGAHVEPRPIAFVCGTAIGWSIVASIAARLAFGRGGSMLGRPRGRLVAVAVLTPAVLLGWMLLWNATFPETLMVWPTRVGFRCLVFTLATAAWPLVAVSYLRRERDPSNAGWAGAARGVAAGALAGILVDLWCPVANPAHVLVGHICPMVLLMLVGALAGRMLVGVRARDPQDARTGTSATK
jgi:hypothetical protein